MCEDPIDHFFLCSQAFLYFIGVECKYRRSQLEGLVTPWGLSRCGGDLGASLSSLTFRSRNVTHQCWFDIHYRKRCGLSQIGRYAFEKEKECSRPRRSAESSERKNVPFVETHFCFFCRSSEIQRFSPSVSYETRFTV